jgi:hypothetical protein
MHFGVDSRISSVGLVLLGLYAGRGGLAVVTLRRLATAGEPS